MQNKLIGGKFERTEAPRLLEGTTAISTTALLKQNPRRFPAEGF
jgi:hypothetical protein